MFQSALEHPAWQEWRSTIAPKCYRYREGDQWTASERKTLKKRRQPETVNNQVSGKNAVSAIRAEMPSRISSAPTLSPTSAVHPPDQWPRVRGARSSRQEFYGRLGSPGVRRYVGRHLGQQALVPRVNPLSTGTPSRGSRLRSWLKVPRMLTAVDHRYACEFERRPRPDFPRLCRTHRHHRLPESAGACLVTPTPRPP
jgi:hypothetical protein